MDKLILCKKYPKHIHKIKKIFHNYEVYYELLIPQYEKNDKLLFEVNPFECHKCKSLFDIKKRLFRLIKIGIIKQLNSGIGNKIIENLKKYYENYVIEESDSMETSWYIHLCYKCSCNKRFKI
jgi:hypothetical protein